MSETTVEHAGAVDAVGTGPGVDGAGVAAAGVGVAAGVGQLPEPGRAMFAGVGVTDLSWPTVTVIDELYVQPEASTAVAVIVVCCDVAGVDRQIE